MDVERATSQDIRPLHILVLNLMPTKIVTSELDNTVDTLETGTRNVVRLAVDPMPEGVNGAFFRVHHFAPQAAAPMPLLSAIASRTKAIEVGTGVIDMR